MVCRDVSLVKLLQIAKEVDTSLPLTVLHTAKLCHVDCNVKVILMFFSLDKDILYDLSAVSVHLNVHKMKIPIWPKTMHFLHIKSTGVGNW
jgi:adenylate cyclase